MKFTQMCIASALVFTLAGCGGGGSGNETNTTIAASDTSATSSCCSTASSTAPNSAPSSTATTTSGNSTSTTSGSSSCSNCSTSPSSGNTSSNPSPSNPVLTCTTPATSASSGGSNLIEADTPAINGTRLYALNSKFTVRLTTRPSTADTLKWTIVDVYSKPVATGSISVPQTATTNTLTCQSSLAGYFAVEATLVKGGGAVTRRGSTPAGYTSFGILPDVSDIIGTPIYTKQDQHRFGMQGFNDDGTMLSALGITQTIDDRQMSVMEPNAKNTFSPSADSLDAYYKSGNTMRLVRLDGIPAWASSNGQATDTSVLPADLTYFTNYLARVGTETEKVRSTYFPSQSANYYQVTWEPDVQWKGTDADFVALYKAAYSGLHSTDGKAVVMGPTDSFPQNTLARLKRLAPLGFNQYIDGVATHGYYDAGTSPSHPPERHATDADPADQANALTQSIRNLRKEMATEYKSGMKLYVTETGISYDLGSTYDGNNSQNMLYAQGMVVARAHIIMLGEGADVTYLFFGPDYPEEVGYGTFFDLDNPNGSFGASNIAPKPAAMTIATMTRVLDGTITLGPITTPSGIYAYSFQQRGSNKVITAVWQHNNATWGASVGFSATNSKAYSLQVDSPGASGTVYVIDAMGNVSKQSYTNGVLPMALTESPQYVISGNLAVAKSISTAPVGYSSN